jgi:hypothetical protein
MISAAKVPVVFRAARQLRYCLAGTEPERRRVMLNMMIGSGYFALWAVVVGFLVRWTELERNVFNGKGDWRVRLE